MPTSVQTHREPTPDRRKYPRVNVRRELTVNVSGRELKVVAADLSFSGAYLETAMPVPPGEHIDVTLKNNGFPITCSARVVHRHPSGIGVAFSDAGDEFLDALYAVIYSYVQEHVPSSDGSDQIPGRILLVHHDGELFQPLYSTHLGKNGIWVVADDPDRFADRFTVTLADRGLFDCEVTVDWRFDRALGLRFEQPNKEFLSAYQAVRQALQG